MRHLRDNPEALDDLADLVLGAKLGEGVDRETYEYGLAPDDYVVKVQRGEYDWQNIAEWQLWVNAPPKLRKHLAPIMAISRGGRVLVMARCEPCPTHLLPKRMPSVLSDLHADNIGLYQGKPVAMDYGRHLAAMMAANASVMKEVIYDGAQ